MAERLNNRQLNDLDRQVDAELVRDLSSNDRSELVLFAFHMRSTIGVPGGIRQRDLEEARFKVEDLKEELKRAEARVRHLLIAEGQSTPTLFLPDSRKVVEFKLAG